jgi:hypothetical protein
MEPFLNSLRKVHNKISIRLNDLPKIKTDFNNWVIPGVVMAGPFPGQDGINFQSDDQACANLQGILADGVDVFASLCAELPHPEDTSFDGKSIGTYFPTYKSYVTIINTHNIATKPIKYEHFKIIDQKVPTDQELVHILTVLLEHISQGKTIFIHCAGGHGRTGTIVASLLLCIFSIDTEFALYFTQHTHNNRRRQDQRTKAFIIPVRSPNSEEQYQLVRAFGVFIRFCRVIMPL